MTLPGHHGLRVSHVTRDEGTSLWVYRDKDTIKLGGKETDGALALVHVDFEPGAGPPPHVHRNESEVIYVLDGQVDVLDHDRRLRAGPGDTVLMPKGSHHAFRNAGDERARILLLFYPAGFEGFFEAFGSTWTPGSEPPPTTLEDARPIAARYGMEFLDDVPPEVWET